MLWGILIRSAMVVWTISRLEIMTFMVWEALDLRATHLEIIALQSICFTCI
jgi:hypothetical protein